MDIEEPIPEPTLEYIPAYVPNYDLAREYVASLPPVLYEEQRLSEMLTYSRSHYSAIALFAPCLLILLIDEVNAVPILHFTIGNDVWVVECNPKNLTNLRTLLLSGYYGNNDSNDSVDNYYQTLRNIIR